MLPHATTRPPGPVGGGRRRPPADPGGSPFYTGTACRRMSTTPDVPIDDLPERYHSLLVRFDAVRSDCARVARLAIARGERTRPTL